VNHGALHVWLAASQSERREWTAIAERARLRLVRTINFLPAAGGGRRALIPAPMRPKTGVGMAFPSLRVQPMDCEEQSLWRRQTSRGLASPIKTDRRTDYCLLLPLLRNNIG
jgi:hypothetical protein